MSIDGHKERSLQRRGLLVKESIQRRTTTDDLAERRRTMVKEDMGHDFILKRYELLCTKSKKENRERSAAAYCGLYNLMLSHSESERIEIDTMVQSIFDSLRPTHKNNKTLGVLTILSCLEHENPTLALMLISDYLKEPIEQKKDGTIVKIPREDIINKIKQFSTKTGDINIDELETFLRTARSLEYVEYEKSFVGPNFDKKYGWIKLDHGFDNIGFVDVVYKTMLNEYDVDFVIDQIFNKISLMPMSSFQEKTDLVVKNQMIDTKGNVILDQGDKIEVKKIDFKAESYLSEFFSIYKSSTILPEYAKTQEFIETYKQIINGLYHKIKNSSVGDKILGEIKKSLKAMIFKDDIIVLMDDISLEWSNIGARDPIKDPRLSIRYKVDLSKNVKGYRYNKSEHSNVLTTIDLKTDKIVENYDYSWFDEYYSDYKDSLEPVKEFIYNKMKDCDLVPIKNEPGFTKYVDKNGDVLFIDDIDTGTDNPYLYVDYDRIWLKCEEMDCSYEDFQKICKDMLHEVHKRKVDTASAYTLSSVYRLHEAHKR